MVFKITIGCTVRSNVGPLTYTSVTSKKRSRNSSTGTVLESVSHETFRVYWADFDRTADHKPAQLRFVAARNPNLKESDLFTIGRRTTHIGDHKSLLSYTENLITENEDGKKRKRRVTGNPPSKKISNQPSAPMQFDSAASSAGSNASTNATPHSIPLLPPHRANTDIQTAGSTTGSQNNSISTATTNATPHSMPLLRPPVVSNARRPHISSILDSSESEYSIGPDSDDDTDSITDVDAEELQELERELEEELPALVDLNNNNDDSSDDDSDSESDSDYEPRRRHWRPLLGNDGYQSPVDAVEFDMGYESSDNENYSDQDSVTYNVCHE